MFNWLLKRLRHVDIPAGDGSLYLRRYFLIKKPWFKMYLHQIMQSDDDRFLHDHPWPFTTIILKGVYWEITPFTGPRGRRCGRFSMIRHKAVDAHRLVLDKPVWTLFFPGKKEREWGFHDPAGWVPWRQYLDSKFGPKKRDQEVKNAQTYMDDEE